MTIQMFNITQTILGSVYASKEAAERLNAPEIMHQRAAKRLQLERLKRPKKIEEPQKAEKVTFDPEQDSGTPKRRRRFAQGTGDEQEDLSEDPLADADPAHPGLGDHIDIMS